MDVSRFYEMRKYAYSLMNGLDPTTGLSFANDTIMNIDSIKKYNQLVYELTDTLIIAAEKEGKAKSKKVPFFILKTDLRKIDILEAPVSISRLCNELNNYALPGMRKLRASDLTRGLTKLGYLCEIIIDEEKSYKKPTDKGIKLGIIAEERQNSYGNKYMVNLYNETAQKYIVTNVMRIIENAK